MKRSCASLCAIAVVLLAGCATPQPTAPQVSLFRDLQRNAAGGPARSQVDADKVGAECRIMANNASAQYRSMGITTGSAAFIAPMRQTYEQTFRDCMLTKDFRFDGFVSE